MSDQKDSGHKINVTSSVIEKSIEMASDFLSKLIMPTVEEFGLLMKESVTSWRIKKQVKILNNAREYCQKHNISPKAISLKVLVPLLENASLEEDELLQDKWSTLLGNMVDPDQNIENNVIPFILSQLSKNEFVQLEKEYHRINRDLDEFFSELQAIKAKYVNDYIPLDQERVDKIKIEELQQKIHETKYVNPVEFKPFEIANLIRCGLIRIIPVQSGYSKDIKYGSGLLSQVIVPQGVNVEIEYVADSYLFTDLGMLFFTVCNDKAVESK